jgi:peptidoglycan/xylan/chitin deacetylase (PgdA/CDA1 family)
MVGLEDAYGAVAALGARSGLHRLRLGRRNAVVMYHSVREPADVRPGTSDVTVAAFRRHLAYYVREFEVVDLPAVLADDGRAGDAKRVALTFDDGYRDLYTNVRPLLHEFDVPATAFVVPGFLDDANPREQVMNTGHLFDVLTSEQVAELVDDPLVTIGNHTRTHHDLGRHHEHDILESEVLGAKRDLEARFGTTVDRFCYPNGRFNATSVDVVGEGHDIATMDESRRPLLPGEHPLLVPRVDGGLPLRQIRWRLSDVNGALMRAARLLVDVD